MAPIPGPARDDAPERECVPEYTAEEALANAPPTVEAAESVGEYAADVVADSDMGGEVDGKAAAIGDLELLLEPRLGPGPNGTVGLVVVAVSDPE